MPDIHDLISKTNGSRLHSLSLDTSSELRSPKATAVGNDGKTNVVQAFLDVETDVGRGKGVVRLVYDGEWKCFTLYTVLEEMKGYEESIGKRRPYGVVHGERTDKRNWADRRREEREMEDGVEPTVLILGAGQAGLTVAARLKMLGVKSLIVDREERIGDNWRTRYHQLVLHDPVWFDHLPYLPFPENWPVFTPKDKLGDWFEAYVNLLELNAWTRTTISKSEWSDEKKQWTVTLERMRDGKMETRIVHPKHVVQATGASGEPNFPSHIKGLDNFKGTRLVHSSKFTGATPSHGQNKKAIVVGCCNSGHDIAQTFYENGYNVTIVQRSSTYVVSSETSADDLAELYGENGIPTHDADMLFHSIPNPVLKKLNVAKTETLKKVDEKLLTGLQKAGFKLDKGPDGAGLWIKYLQRGGGYYLDVGCSQLIIDGKVRVKQGQEITEVLENGIKFADGEVVEADEIVFATGYLNMRTQCRKIFGDEVAERVGDVWGFDAEGEVRGTWRKTGHEGFWFAGGNLALCRWGSRRLGLLVKGLVEGVCAYGDL
ncbi:flavin-containing monooxygenase protein [Rutstroemia sp. NJR-2017a BVV2]|nr:flavin-containing monooxygenase protein [Rutstroemia sp. NJR-2017a BVV2]